MTEAQKIEGKKFLAGCQASVPNFVRRSRQGGDLRSASTTGVQGALSKTRRNPDEMVMAPRHGVTLEEARVVLDEFLEEMGTGSVSSRFRTPIEDPDA